MQYFIEGGAVRGVGDDGEGTWAGGGGGYMDPYAEGMRLGLMTTVLAILSPNRCLF